MPVNKWLKTRKEKKEAEEREAVQAGLQRGEVRKGWSLGHRGAAGNQFREDLPKCLERKDTWKEKLNRGIKEDWNSSAFKDTETLAEDKNLTMEIKTGNKQSAARPGELSFCKYSPKLAARNHTLCSHDIFACLLEMVPTTSASSHCRSSSQSPAGKPSMGTLEASTQNVGNSTRADTNPLSYKPMRGK